jgi:hypothetical protein
MRRKKETTFTQTESIRRVHRIPLYVSLIHSHNWKVDVSEYYENCES